MGRGEERWAEIGGVACPSRHPNAGARRFFWFFYVPREGRFGKANGVKA